MQKIKLKIIGIHCQSCKELIENEIKLIPGIKNIILDYETYIARIIFDEKKTSKHEITKTIENLNYEVKQVEDNNIDKKKEKKLENNPTTKKNIIIGGILLILMGIAYYLISHNGAFELLGKLNESNLSYPLIFIIGLLASFHCIGMCGGIVIAYTSRYCSINEVNKKSAWPHLSYNLGRIVSYTAVGIILGGIGSFFAQNSIFIGAVTLLAGIFMIAVGLSLITRHFVLDKITAILPKSFVRVFSNQLHASRLRAPFVIGFLNGFMPCGPLQAMQIYSLTTGSALIGGISMAVYALGTAPVMFGFGNMISLFSQSKIKQFVKLSGLIVIILGLFTIYRSFTSFSFQSITPEAKLETISPKNNPINSKTGNKQNSTIGSDIQIAKMDLTYQGYEPSTLTVKKGIPVKWVVNARQISGCTSEILMPAFNINKSLKKGENIIEFTPKVAGTYKFSCGMQMVWGKFIVTD